MEKDIAIITVTRERPLLLNRAIRSVVNQDCYCRINHYIIIDDCRETLDFLYQNSLTTYCNAQYLKRGPNETTGPSRCAFCLNNGVSITSERWIAFLDDDNEIEYNHISSLLSCAEKVGTRAVHSYMKVFHSNGQPYLEKRNPWCSDPEESLQEYQWMLFKGVRSKNSNVFKDSIDPSDHSPVDLGEWLLRRDLLCEIPFVTQYSEDDLKIGRHEDDKFLDGLLSTGEPIACSCLPTLHYYLGGYSTKNGGYVNPYLKENYDE